MDNTLNTEAEEIKRSCEPAIRALMELLAQEEWQAYLDHLRTGSHGPFSRRRE